MRGAAVLHASPRTGVAGIFMMAQTSPRTHKLISKDSSCEIYPSLFLSPSLSCFSQDSSFVKLSHFFFKLMLKESSSFRSTVLNENRMHSTSSGFYRGWKENMYFTRQFHFNYNNSRTKLGINPRNHYRYTRGGPSVIWYLQRLCPVVEKFHQFLFQTFRQRCQASENINGSWEKRNMARSVHLYHEQLE